MDVSVGTGCACCARTPGLTQASWRHWPTPIRLPSTATKLTGAGSALPYPGLVCHLF